eukprot:TCALIF_10838-PA protein Name:"Similar to CCDC41 Centrosomal protein of 83 kDa (Homo sapiens)" AED:0.14 eAED:0.14 QI:0/0.62/0.44/0.66/1/1/9/0/652
MDTVEKHPSDKLREKLSLKMALSTTDMTSGIDSEAALGSPNRSRISQNLKLRLPALGSGRKVKETEEDWPNLGHPDEMLLQGDEAEDNKNLGVMEMESIAQRLAGDGELHKLLTHEKMRNEVHKSNYEKLKAEFLKLSHENRALCSEVAKLETKNSVQEDAIQSVRISSSASIQKLRDQMKALLVQIPSEAEHIDLEAKLASQMEAKWRSHLQEICEETEALKLSVQNLLTENLGLKTALHHLGDESGKVLDECHLKYSKQVQNLQSLNKTLDSNRGPELDKLRIEATKLNQENLKLRSKVQFLETNLEDSVATIRHKDIANARIITERSKSESLSSGKIRKLDAEKMELENSLKKSQNELTKAKLATQDHITEINLLKNELNSLKNQLLEKENSQLLILNQLKVNIAKERSSLQTEIDSLTKRVKHWKSEQVKKSTEMESLKQDMEKLSRQQDESMNTQKAHFAAQVGQMESRLMELSAVNKSLQRQLRAKEVSTGTSCEHNEEFEAKLKAWTSERSILEENLERCRQENSILTQKHKEMVVNNQSCTQQVNDLKCQIAQFQNEAAQANSRRKMEKMEPHSEMEKAKRPLDPPETKIPKKEDVRENSTQTEDAMLLKDDQLKTQLQELEAKHKLFQLELFSRPNKPKDTML